MASSRFSLLGSLALIVAIGCNDPAPTERMDIEDQGNGVMRLHPDEASLAPDIPEGTPGEGASGPIQSARDCVFVQWCNEPGPRGTICRARPECGCSGVIECNEEVRSICGGFTDPAYFLCPGQP